jgi:hypothetical protein
MNPPQTNIHPNPVTDELTIVHSSGTITTILIQNASGQLVKMISPDKLSVTISVRDLLRDDYYHRQLQRSKNCEYSVCIRLIPARASSIR